MNNISHSISDDCLLKSVVKQLLLMQEASDALSKLQTETLFRPIRSFAEVDRPSTTVDLVFGPTSVTV